MKVNFNAWFRPWIDEHGRSSAWVAVSPTGGYGVKVSYGQSQS
jgi:hypothetical protein